MLILFFATFINIVGFGIVFPLLPIIKLDFHLDEFQTAFIVSSFAIGSAIGGLILGFMSDKLGRKVILVSSSLVGGLSYFFILFVDSYGELLVVRFLNGLFVSSVSVVFAYIADISNQNNRFSNMGKIGAAFTLGFIIGPVLSGFLMEYGSLHQLNHVEIPFIVTGSLVIFSGVLSLLLQESLPASERESDKNQTIGVFLQKTTAMYRQPQILALSFLNTVMFIFFSAEEAFISLWLNDLYQFSPKHIAYFWAVIGALLTVTQIYLNFLSIQTSIVVGFFIYGLATLLVGITLTPSYINLACIILCICIAVGFVMPKINGGLAMTVNKNQHGALFSITQTIGTLGNFLGPIAIGALYYYKGHTVAWLSLTILSLVCMAIAYQYLSDQSSNS